MKLSDFTGGHVCALYQQRDLIADELSDKICISNGLGHSLHIQCWPHTLPFNSFLSSLDGSSWPFFMKTFQTDDVFLLIWAAVRLCQQASEARARWILLSRCCCVFPCWVSNCSISLYKSLEFILLVSSTASQNPYQYYEKTDYGQSSYLRYQMDHIIG